MSEILNQLLDSFKKCPLLTIMLSIVIGAIIILAAIFTFLSPREIFFDLLYKNQYVSKNDYDVAKRELYELNATLAKLKKLSPNACSEMRDKVALLQTDIQYADTAKSNLYSFAKYKTANQQDSNLTIEEAHAIDEKLKMLISRKNELENIYIHGCLQ